MQDVFVNLWDNRETFNIKISIKTYLYTSVKNSCLNYIKRENFFSSTDENNEPPDKSGKTQLDKMEEDEINSAIRNAINKLPEKCREIFMMCRYDELSYKEIAEILDISINTVKTQLKRAMKNLYANLGHLRSIIIFVQFMVWWYANK